MALNRGMPPTSPFPSGRYTVSNPLRREGGLRLLTHAMPEPLRRLLMTNWRRPCIFDGKITPLALQSTHRQRPSEASLLTTPPRLLGWFSLTELEIARRVLEAPMASISRGTRNSLLIAQGAYLRSLYAALAAQLGEAGALAEFHRLILKVG